LRQRRYADIVAAMAPARIISPDLSSLHLLAGLLLRLAR
jgi:hypothetical protein